jgi:PPOX class probable F420-dependent enzyme
MLDDKVRELCQGANYAALTTLFPSGQPQTQLMWIDCDDEHVIFNTAVHRAKFENVAGDARVSIAIWDVTDPMSYVEVRGRAVEFQRGQDAREHVDQLAHKYTGADYAGEAPSDRVVVKIKPDRQIIH